jgi:hypothetical protein
MINTVPASALTNISMVEGNEKIYKIVIDNGMLKEWVGIGWIELRKATAKDKDKYPTIKRD